MRWLKRILEHKDAWIWGAGAGRYLVNYEQWAGPYMEEHRLGPFRTIAAAKEAIDEMVRASR